MAIKDNQNTRFFKFRLESDSESKTSVIPQTVGDGSDVFQVASSWSKVNLPGSTEPMVAFNYVDAPTLTINIKFHEDMWREANLNPSGYLDVINKFISLSYPGASGQIIKPPYVIISFDNYTYRGYFTSIRINQSGVMRNGYKNMCEVSGSFIVIKKYAPKQLEIASGFRAYFN